MSNILSASSSTTYVTLRRFVTRPVKGEEKTHGKQNQMEIWFPLGIFFKKCYIVSLLSNKDIN